MFERLFKKQYSVHKHLHAPLLDERLKYLQYYCERGVSLAYLRQVAQYLLKIIELLSLKTHGTVSIKEIERAAVKWATYKPNQRIKRCSFSVTGQKKFTDLAIAWLKQLDRLESLPEERIPLFNDLFKRRRILKHHILAPLLKERLLFLQHYKDSGVVKTTLQRAAEQLLRIMKQLKFYELRKVATEEIIQTAIDCDNKNKYKTSKSRNGFIFYASAWLEMIGCLVKRNKKPILFESYIQQYLNYMRDEKELSEQTIKSRTLFLRRFLEILESKTHLFKEITPIMLEEVFIKKYPASVYERISIKTYASVLRVFFRYAGCRNTCSKNLANSIKAPRVYTHELLPSAPAWEDVKKLLKNTDGNHPTDIRNHAICMLLAIYGMRSSEVANLKLCDLDWREEFIYVRRAKNAKSQKFPLSKNVGDAILHYIKKVRPNNSLLKEIFICMRAPYRPLTNKSIYDIVKKELKPLVPELKHHGPHALRHACASYLINHGVSLKEISEYLGHQQLETTRVYTKIDLGSLRKITEFEIGDLL